MSLTINTSQASTIALRALNRSQNAMDRALARLSTGQNAPSARYDAAGVAISSRIRGEIVSMQRYQLNAQQGVSMLQIAEGAYQRVEEMLVRMRSLSAQAQSGHLSAVERGMLNTEYQQIKAEIDRLAGSVRFNGTEIFDSGDLSLSTLTGNTNNNTLQNGRFADMNGDGIVDLILSMSSTASTNVYLGNGNGTFSNTVYASVAANHTNFQTGDFNGDGNEDVAIYDGAGNINLYYNNGNATFTTAQAVSITSGAFIVADMDNDGRDDIISRSATAVTVILAGANNSFTQSSTATGAVSNSTLSVVDMNNDGFLDIMHRAGASYQLFMNNSGTISTGNTGALTLSTSQDFFDVNGDGLMDLVYMSSAGSLTHIRLNNGNNNFSTNAYTYTTGGATGSGNVFFGDHNGDGVMDLIHMTGRYFSYAQGLSQINFNTLAPGSIDSYFRTATVIDTGLNIFSSSYFGDVNGDHKMDVVRTASNGGVITTTSLINNTTLGLEGTFRVSGDPASQNNIAFRMGSVSLNSLNYMLGNSMINSIGTARRSEQYILAALENLKYFRTSVGATINRLEKVQDNIATMIENQEGARSSLADLDVAKEMTEYTAQKIVQQAGISMLTQANKMQAMIAKLIQFNGGDE